MKRSLAPVSLYGRVLHDGHHMLYIGHESTSAEGGGRVDRDTSKDSPERAFGIVEDIRALMDECIQKIRRRDPPESWKSVDDRIAEIRDRLDRQDPQTPCTCRGAQSRTADLHLFERQRAVIRWRQRDRCLP